LAVLPAQEAVVVRDEAYVGHLVEGLSPDGNQGGKGNSDRCVECGENGVCGGAVEGDDEVGVLGGLGFTVVGEYVGTIWSMLEVRGKGRHWFCVCGDCAEELEPRHHPPLHGRQEIAGGQVRLSGIWGGYREEDI
jgi:hypothetical protein